MILEGLVTTLNAEGTPHLAPMGPTVDGEAFDSFLLRPFPTSTTGQNLIRTREGVLHVTDDALLLARAAVGAAAMPAHRPAEVIRGVILKDACRAYEFRIREVDDSRERIHLTAEVLRVHRHRDFFGWNRAKHAVVEAAILATRFSLLPAETIAAEFQRLRVIVDKTGGEPEHQAMTFLESEWSRYLAGAGA